MIRRFLVRLIYADDFRSLAAMRDAEFMRSLERLQAHESGSFRATCAARWVAILWPNDPASLHAADASRHWRERKFPPASYFVRELSAERSARYGR